MAWTDASFPNKINKAVRSSGFGMMFDGFASGVGHLKLDILMPKLYHQGVRTTLTLDDDVSVKLRAESRRSGKPFKQTVNDYLRLGLSARSKAASAPPFKVKARPLGLRPGFSYDNVWELIEQIEGPFHR
jgi:hypothetical protein